MHSFARHFHIYFRFTLQVSETLITFAPDYNTQYVKGLENNGYLRHLFLYNKGICTAQGDESFFANCCMQNTVFCRRIIWQFQQFVTLLGANGVTLPFLIYTYAREVRRATPINRGLARVPFVLFCYACFSYMQRTNIVVFRQSNI